MDVRGQSSLFFWRPDGEERVRALFFRLVDAVESSSVVGKRSPSSLSTILARLELFSDKVDGGALRSRSSSVLRPPPRPRFRPLGFSFGCKSCQCLAFSAAEKSLYSLASYLFALMCTQASTSSSVGLRGVWSLLPRPPPPRPLPGPPRPKDEMPLRVVPGLSKADVVHLKLV